MDIEYLLFLQRLREASGGRFDSFFSFLVTISVDYWIVVPILILFWTVNKRKASQVAFSLGGSMLLGSFLKATFCVYRPWIRDPRVKPLESVMSGASGYSFPSGHSTCAGGFWGGLAFSYKKYRGFVIFCIAMVLIVMFGRNFVGVHTPQDVIVGGLCALLMGFLADKLLAAVDKNPRLDIVIFIASAVICTVLLLYLYNKPYPMDYVDGKLLVDPKKMTVDSFKDPGTFFGFIAGWFLERRFVNFSTDGTPMEKVMRSLVGGFLYIFIQLCIVIPGAKAIGVGAAYFFFFALNNAAFMTVYPLLAKKVEARARKRRETVK